MKGKKIILAITGSIAAYKSAFLTRLLVKSGAEVQVLMTEAATHFITSLTLSTLSKKPVFTEIISEDSWNSHVELGLWADAMLIAPATATTLAKLATGMSDNIVTAVYLSARCPVFIAPAMDLDMWEHPATVRNLNLLRGDNCNLIPVGGMFSERLIYLPSVGLAWITAVCLGDLRKYLLKIIGGQILFAGILVAGVIGLSSQSYVYAQHICNILLHAKHIGQSYVYAKHICNLILHAKHVFYYTWQAGSKQPLVAMCTAAAISIGG